MLCFLRKSPGPLAATWNVWFTTCIATTALAFGALRAMWTVSRLLQGSGGPGQPSMWKRLPCFFWTIPLLFSRIFNTILMLWTRLVTRRVSCRGIDETRLDGLPYFTEHIHRLEASGPRFTGSEAHESYVKWLEDELNAVPKLQVASTDVSLLSWLPKGSLQESATLTLANDHSDHIEIRVAGAVPYSLPTTGSEGQLVHVPRNRRIRGDELKGKMVLRDFPARQVPYALGIIPSYSTTTDLHSDLLNFYDRPGFADQIIHDDLLDASQAKAAGVLFMFDLPLDQVTSYFEPHKGTHYRVPAAYLGIEEATALRAAASDITTKTSAALTIGANVTKRQARTLTAILPGQTNERIIYVTHTDGNTCVQENGAVALLSLARYFAQRPLSSRSRTIEFAFNVGHLHISREGSLAQAKDLDASFDGGNDPVTLVIPVEHLGTREIEAVHQPNEPGRRLCFTGRGEVMFWCAGPSPPVVKASIAAVARRKLDRVVVTRGVSRPNFAKTPPYSSFGGIGTYYHNLLLPTTSLISGPWSLWAPSFGGEAVDVVRLRQQTLALGDIYESLEGTRRQEIVRGYEGYRRKRSLPGRSWTFEEPPEQAPDVERLHGDVVKY
ncbi:hypothetical protein EDB81DRAFT_772590 [Dactylonectria macrodidyma]|uniref:Uncharacterized protein n=1 Tax=Dactylonectria macrodidyma TaxID=307937 RepID=A0A9P9JNS1_9HYPO|nr:hypothetical protein EDB81DRAFT_772590 [Dactylonectria macrodidyma]